jgi:RNA recognition motif-containing protein
MKKIFVGNLSWKVTEDILKPLFEAFGEVVSVKIITDPYTGKSKGFGFVEMKNAGDATKAIEGLNNQPLDGRDLRVSQAQERQQRNGNRQGSFSGGGAGGPPRDRDRGERGGFRPRSQDRGYHS